MNEPALSDEADPLYVPLGDPGPWAEAPVDAGAWSAAMRRLDDLRRGDPAWSDMVLAGARLAAAHRSGAMDGAHGGDDDVESALLAGVATLAGVGEEARAHVRANAGALDVAVEEPVVTEEVVRRVHEVACRPQLTHRVRVDDRVQDHVFAHGEYKHHPNHVPTAAGGWLARAPVRLVGAEMDRFLTDVAGPGLAGAHPPGRAAYLLHGVTHVAPFADGNGRVARALAGAVLVRSCGVPLLVPTGETAAYDDALLAAGTGDPGPLVELVLRCTVDLVDRMAEVRVSPTSAGAAALDRWRRRAEAAQAVLALLPGAVRDALDRHGARTDLGWLSPLTEAEVLGDGPLVIRVPLPGGAVVEEVVAVDAHPMEDDGIALRAEEARVRLGVGLDDPRPAVAARLGPWLDRVLSTLALRVAAETE